VTTIVQHRAITPDGKVLTIVTMAACTRWMPYASFGIDGGLADCPGEHALETRVLPDGEWEPSAVVRQPGHQPVVITRGTLGAAPPVPLWSATIAGR
jgi:hypothetical protein